MWEDDIIRNFAASKKYEFAARPADIVENFQKNGFEIFTIQIHLNVSHSKIHKWRYYLDWAKFALWN